jgi:hypothetical protein
MARLKRAPSRAGAPLPAGLPPLYEAALRVVARDALLLHEGVLTSVL